MSELRPFYRPRRGLTSAERRALKEKSPGRLILGAGSKLGATAPIRQDPTRRWRAAHVRTYKGAPKQARKPRIRPASRSWAGRSDVRASVRCPVQVGAWWLYKPQGPTSQGAGRGLAL